MYAQEYQHIFENEEGHFYFQANHAIIEALLRHYMPVKKPRILDAGCGTGYFVNCLQKIGVAQGVDVSARALKLAKKRKAAVTKGSVTNLPFPNNRFDVITSMDVINHLRVRDPQRAFDEFYRVLKPGGILILRVPANPHIHLTHDIRVHTDHRWSKRETREKAKQSGFEIIRLSFVNMLLLPAAYLIQIGEKITKATSEKSSIVHIHIILNRILSALLRLESMIIPHVELPFGLGIILVAQKPPKI